MQNEQPSGPEYSLPLGLRYNLSINDAVPSSKNLQQFLASNASDYTDSSNNVIRIPVGSPAFLDLKNSLLQFDFKNTSTGGTTVMQLDGGADAIFRRIRLIASNGDTIEEVREYGLLSTIIDQYTSSTGRARVDGVLKGAPSKLNDLPYFPSSGGGTNTVTNNGITITGGSAGAMTLSSIGGKGYDPDQSDRLNANVTRKYMCQLKLGMFNLATAKLLAPNTNFTMEIELNSAVNCTKCNATNVSYQVNNVELHCPAIVINDSSFMQKMNARMAQGLVFKCNSFQHYVNTTSSSAGVDVKQISARARSLKALMSVFRIQTNVVAKNHFSLSKRSLEYIENYQYRIGSTNYPTDRVAVDIPDNADGSLVVLPATDNLNISESYSQALRVMGNINMQSADILVDGNAFANSEANNGVGIAAIDLTSYSDNSVNSGIQTLDNMPISFEFQKNSSLGSSTCQIDTFAIMEMSLVRSPDGVLQSFV